MSMSTAGCKKISAGLTVTWLSDLIELCDCCSQHTVLYWDMLFVHNKLTSGFLRKPKRPLSISRCTVVGWMPVLHMWHHNDPLAYMLCLMACFQLEYTVTALSTPSRDETLNSPARQSGRTLTAVVIEGSRPLNSVYFGRRGESARAWHWNRLKLVFRCCLTVMTRRR